MARVDVVGDIDRLLGLCPCGAPGDPYCSDDCRPTHRTRDTLGDTAMRWRPDLVTAAADNNLEPHNGEPLRDGRFAITTYSRTDRLAWHVRVDDGHRFVGRDLELADLDGTDEDVVRRIARTIDACKWELTDPRHAVPDDPWHDVAHLWDERRMDRARICQWLRANNLNPDDVPRHTRIVVTRNTITLDVYLRGDEGGLLFDTNRVLTEQRTVPLLLGWPSGLRAAGLVTFRGATGEDIQACFEPALSPG